MSEQNPADDKAAYPAIIGSLKSPLSVFGLAMLVCNAVFSLAAAFMDELDAFIYAIHTFLAIVFAFIAIAVWSPRSLYHPAELAGLEAQVPDSRSSKIIITIAILLSGFAYAGYQAYKFDVARAERKACEEAAGAGQEALAKKAEQPGTGQGAAANDARVDK